MRSRSAAFAAVAVLLVLAACGGGDDSASSTTPPTDAAEPPFPTASIVEDLVDDSRPTVGADGSEVAPARTITTTVWYPEGADRPVPLVVLAHGFTGHPDKFDELASAWASAGYVVAAPAFPLTNRDAPGGAVLADYRAQPADVSFVIDEVLAAAEDPSGLLDGLVDGDHVGVAGHSLGGITTLGAGFNSCCRDERIDAVVVMDATELEFEGTYDYAGTPTMVLHGDVDELVPHAAGVALYERVAPPKYLVTIIGGTHSAPFEDDPHPADAAVVDMTTLFWDGYLGEDPDAVSALVEDGTVEGVTTLDYVAG